MTVVQTNAAKAAALLCFTSSVESREKAVEIYNQLDLADTDDQMIQILDQHGAAVWAAVGHMDMETWWANVYSLAVSIEECREELK